MIMEFVMRRHGRVTSLGRILSGVVGAGLLGLLLHTPPTFAQTARETRVFQATISQNGQYRYTDCFRLSEDHSFWTDVMSYIARYTEGSWNWYTAGATDDQDDKSFTASMHKIVGGEVIIVSFGGLMKQNDSVMQGTISFDPYRVTYQYNAQANDQCQGQISQPALTCLLTLGC
jgi:hypothetical protein